MAVGLNELNSIAQQIPEINSRASEAAKSAMGVQAGAQAMQAAGQPGADLRQVAQQTTAATTRAAGQLDTQAMRQSQKQLAQIGKQGIESYRQMSVGDLANQENLQKKQLAEEANRLRIQQTGKEIASTRKITEADLTMKKQLAALGIERDNDIMFATTAQREHLAALGSNIKDKILDSRLAFDRDELGRKFTNERQLEDVAILTAQNDNQLRSKLQMMNLMHDRKMSIMKMAHRKTLRVLEQGYIKEKGDLDRATERKLRKMLHDTKMQIQKEAAEKRARYARQGAMIKMATGAAVIAATAYGGPAAGMAVQTAASAAQETE
jgi:hypothetical protein